MDHQRTCHHNNKCRMAYWGQAWRSSVWFITLIIGLGITVDLLVYSIVIPVLPFQLERLRYAGISGLVGWMLFAYSMLIAASQERYRNRKYPLLTGQIVLIASQILLMEAPTYWVMVLARSIQGISSSMIWVVGLALICDAVPQHILGSRQLGISMVGMSLGLLVGPPLGGVLYNRFGFRGPFILGILVTVVDLIGRILIIDPNQVKRCTECKANETDVTDKDHARLHGPEPGIIHLPLQDANPPPRHCISMEESRDGGFTNSSTSHPPLSLVAVIWRLLRSPRAIAAPVSSDSGIWVRSTLRLLHVPSNLPVFSIVYSSQEPVVPLYLQAHWGLYTDKIGLVYLAAVIPTFFSSPLAGWWIDHKGTEWVTVLMFLVSLPWWVLITVRCTLTYFVAMLAIQSFFTAAVISPLTAELAAVSRTHPGVGYAHVYGAFNLFYGVGVSLGPIIAGQIYDHLSDGWTVICLLATGLVLASCLLLALWCTGDSPLLRRLLIAISRRRMVAQAYDEGISEVTLDHVC